MRSLRPSVLDTTPRNGTGNAANPPAAGARAEERARNTSPDTDRRRRREHRHPGSDQHSKAITRHAWCSSAPGARLSLALADARAGEPHPVALLWAMTRSAVASVEPHVR
jgi:hypothetical protein